MHHSASMISIGHQTTVFRTKITNLSRTIKLVGLSRNKVPAYKIIKIVSICKKILYWKPYFQLFRLGAYHCCKMLWHIWSFNGGIIRADSRFAHSQWEMALLCNDISHWLGASLESTLILHSTKHLQHIDKPTLAWLFAYGDVDSVRCQHNLLNIL